MTKNPGYLKLRKIRAAQNIAKTVRKLAGQLIQHLLLVVATYLMVIVAGVGALAFFKWWSDLLYVLRQKSVILSTYIHDVVWNPQLALCQCTDWRGFGLGILRLGLGIIR